MHKLLLAFALTCLAGCSSPEGLAPVELPPPPEEPPPNPPPDDPPGPFAPLVDPLAQEVPARAPTATGRGGAASTVDVLGTLAAIEVLKRGGNAIDAAVASAAVLGVTDPFSCGVGGGGFMLIYLADEQRVVTIDHRETAPQAFTSSLWYENGAPVALNDLITSGLSVGVPGTVRGWAEALRRYGTLDLADVLVRAVHVAEHGFEIDFTFNDQTQRNIDRFRQIPSSAALFLDASGEAYPIGSVFLNPDLGQTYRLLAEQGEDAFYDGELADAIVAAVTAPPVASDATLIARPGVMQKADLSNYEVRVRLPVETTYRGYSVYGMDLASSGGLTVGVALNLLSGWDPAPLTQADLLHLYLESSRLAFADRNAFLGDPEFVEVPREGLLSAAYADVRRALIDPQQASTAGAPAGDPFAYQTDGSAAPQSFAPGLSPGDATVETTHITISDAAGNIVTYTCTIESEGGNGFVVPGYGFLLNNELTDFNIPSDPAATHPNVAEPDKRPRSSISPTIVLQNGAPILALGSPGGSTIITTVLQMLVSHLDLGMPIDEALAAPRVTQRNAPDGSSVAETAFLGTPDAAALQAMGHVLNEVPAIGAATAIRFHEDGTVTAAAEPVRREGGSAMVVQGP